jgi:hypothetical protein
MQIEIKFYCNEAGNCKYQVEGSFGKLSCKHHGFDRGVTKSNHMICTHKEYRKEALKKYIKSEEIMKDIKVKSINHLKEILADGESHEFVLRLNGGMNSSKLISYDNERFYIVNMIDDSEQDLSEEGLRTHSNIAEAIEKGALYQEMY